MAGVRKLPSGSWQARYVGPDGRRYSKTFTHKLGADYWLTSEQRAVSLETWTTPKERAAASSRPKGLTVGQHAAEEVAQRGRRSSKPLKATTIDNYAKLLRLTLDVTPLSRFELATVTRADVAEWRWAMPEERATLNGQAYSLLHSVFAEAVRAGLIETNPATLKGAGKPQRRREQRALTADQARAYLDAAHVKWRAALLIMVTAGLRIGEVLALHVDDLDLDRGTVTVRATVTKVSTADHRRRERVLQAPKTAAARRTQCTSCPNFPPLSRLLQGRLECPGALLFPDTSGGSSTTTFSGVPITRPRGLSASAGSAPTTCEPRRRR